MINLLVSILFEAWLFTWYMPFDVLERKIEKYTSHSTPKIMIISLKYFVPCVAIFLGCMGLFH